VVKRSVFEHQYENRLDLLNVLHRSQSLTDHPTKTIESKYRVIELRLAGGGKTTIWQIEIGGSSAAQEHISSLNLYAIKCFPRRRVPIFKLKQATRWYR
jgi:hypothetical protein